MKTKIEYWKLYELCNNNQLFTSGSGVQYEKVFKIAENGITKDELALILYLCSKQSLEEIVGIIEPLFTNGGKS